MASIAGAGGSLEHGDWQHLAQTLIQYLYSKGEVNIHIPVECLEDRGQNLRFSTHTDFDTNYLVLSISEIPPKISAGG